jgi:hypothetical protein
MKIRRQGPRQQSTIARAERDGVVLCPEVLMVVKRVPVGLGEQPRDDLTAWFYGALDATLATDLEAVAAAARTGKPAPATTVDLILRTPGGELRLDGCAVGLPVRYAGPASTLEFRVSHPGTAAAPAQLQLVA